MSDTGEQVLAMASASAPTKWTWRDWGRIRAVVGGSRGTKRVILEIYDDMAAAARTGGPYETRLDPPPADPRVAHPESTRPAWAKKGAR